MDCILQNSPNEARDPREDPLEDISEDPHLVWQEDFPEDTRFSSTNFQVLEGML